MAEEIIRLAEYVRGLPSEAWVAVAIVAVAVFAIWYRRAGHGK